jgi:phosphohistidine phosphatase SixA
MVPAILSRGKIVTGSHHGEAFSKLNVEEQNDDLISGFIDYENMKFVYDDQVIYLKEIILLRHAEADTRFENGPITPQGHNQAINAAKFLAKLDLKGFIGFSSPYRRCQETSEVITEICSISFNINPLLTKSDHPDYDTVYKMLDILPMKSVLVTHSDFIQNMLILNHLLKERLRAVANCSITYVNQARLIWLAREIA